MSNKKLYCGATMNQYHSCVIQERITSIYCWATSMRTIINIIANDPMLSLAYICMPMLHAHIPRLISNFNCCDHSGQNGRHVKNIIILLWYFFPKDHWWQIRLLSLFSILTNEMQIRGWYLRKRYPQNYKPRPYCLNASVAICLES